MEKSPSSGPLKQALALY